MGKKRVFHFRRIDVFAARHNHVFDAVMDKDIAFFIEKTGIAGIKPAIFHRFCRGIGLVPIAFHNRAAAHDNLADLALRHIISCLIDNAQFDTRIGLTARAQLIARRIMVFRFQISAAAGGFGETVNLNKIAFELGRRLHQ